MADNFDKACIFVDGENLRHALVDLLAGDFQRADYLPKNAKWIDFFDHLRIKALASRRIRTYWYVVEHLDFWPWRIPLNRPDLLERLIGRNERFSQKLSGLTGKPREDELQNIGAELRKKKTSMTNGFNGWSVVHEGIARNCEAVEFRKSGAITYDLFTGDLGTEKAVDVMLSIDLLEMRDIYDVAIIVSGDQDYVPAVQAIKDKGKRVLNVSFLKRNGKLLPSGAGRLNNITDSVLEIRHEEMQRFMGFVS